MYRPSALKIAIKKNIHKADLISFLFCDSCEIVNVDGELICYIRDDSSDMRKLALENWKDGRVEILANNPVHLLMAKTDKKAAFFSTTGAWVFGVNALEEDEFDFFDINKVLPKLEDLSDEDLDSMLEKNKIKVKHKGARYGALQTALAKAMDGETDEIHEGRPFTSPGADS